MSFEDNEDPVKTAFIVIFIVIIVAGTIALIVVDPAHLINKPTNNSYVMLYSDNKLYSNINDANKICQEAAPEVCRMPNESIKARAILDQFGILGTYKELKGPVITANDLQYINSDVNKLDIHDLNFNDYWTKINSTCYVKDQMETIEVPCNTEHKLICACQQEGLTFE